MSEPRPPEDPIWSRWRERHGPGNGAQQPKTAPEPEPERITFGDPLDPGWSEARRTAENPRPEGEAEHRARDHGTREHECLDWCPICRTADLVRASFPPEVRSQLEDVQRDALIAFRTILDHYIERLDGRDRPDSRVEDIPIS